MIPLTQVFRSSGSCEPLARPIEPSHDATLQAYTDLVQALYASSDFRYRYGRQQEVMGVGAADPDSIMVIQLIDDQGKAIVSYVRNPDNPGQIWKVQGQHDSSMGRPNASRILETLELGN